MRSLAFVRSLKDRHERLFILAQQYDKATLETSAKSDVNLDVIKSLVDDLKKCADVVSTLDDYKWVCDALLKWEVMASDLFDEVIDADIPPAPVFLAPPSPFQTKALSENEVDHWLESLAEFGSAYRRALLNRASSIEEMQQDVGNAELFFARDVIFGRINLASRISTETYPRLERLWIKDVKNLSAYLIWKSRVDSGGPGSAVGDYVEAARRIREMLVNRGIKAHKSEFTPVRDYLESKYISNGRIDYEKATDARHLVRVKAERIYNVTRNTDDVANWIEAENYCSLYYNNIVNAVMSSNEEAVLSVLKAFQFSKAPEHYYYVISVFETVLAIYFLDADVILSLWDRSELQPLPETSVASAVNLDHWPAGYQVPESCRGTFLFTGKEILFRGLMTESQLRDLERGVGSRERVYLRQLFDKTRLIHRFTTL